VRKPGAAGLHRVRADVHAVDPAAPASARRARRRRSVVVLPGAVGAEQPTTSPPPPRGSRRPPRGRGPKRLTRPSSSMCGAHGGRRRWPRPPHRQRRGGRTRHEASRPRKGLDIARRAPPGGAWRPSSSAPPGDRRERHAPAIAAAEVTGERPSARRAGTSAPRGLRAARLDAAGGVLLLYRLPFPALRICAARTSCRGSTRCAQLWDDIPLVNGRSRRYGDVGDLSEHDGPPLPQQGAGMSFVGAPVYARAAGRCGAGRARAHAPRPALLCGCCAALCRRCCSCGRCAGTRRG